MHLELSPTEVTLAEHQRTPFRIFDGSRQLFAKRAKFLVKIGIPELAPLYTIT